jgi:fatty acid/phospholipid biosynthesis enzyme
VAGTCIIGHGRSGPDAVFNALRVARESVEQRVNDKIREHIGRRKTPEPAESGDPAP